MARTTALETVQRQSWGGTYFDSITHAAMFRAYQPHNAGVRSAQLYSAQLGSHLINKKFTYYTVAKNNIYKLPGGVDDYTWSLGSATEVDFRISEQLVADDALVGKGKQRFKFALDRNWVHEPVILKTESSDLPGIRVIGYPKQRGANSYEYVGELQTSDLNAYIPVKYLQPGRRLIDLTTTVTDELNQKYGGDQYGEMTKLQSWTGNYARKAEFTDKFIRTEIACRKEGRSLPTNQGYTIAGKTYYDGAIGVGYVYQQDFMTNENKKISKGVFVTQVEARLEERLMRDREMNMQFGQLEKTVDNDSGRTMKVAPGWNQLVRDGHYKEHHGSLTLSELSEYLAEIFTTRKDFSDRKIKLAGGEAAIDFLHRMIAAEAAQWTYIDTLFTQKRTDGMGYHDNELEYGAQFTKIKLPMGYVIEIVYDPIKDDRQLFPELAPGTNRTIESYSMDIFDFGVTDQKARDAARSENITCVMQDGVESYFQVSNVYNFETGAITDGSNAYSNNKELGLYRETSGALCIWDISRVGRIAFKPLAA